MHLHRPVALAIAALALTACSFLAAARGMKDTTIPSNPDNYDALVGTATNLGWTTQRGSGKRDSLDDWDLQVFPAPGQKIILTKNNHTGNISFNCKGGPLDDKQACIAAANQLFAPTFNATY